MYLFLLIAFLTSFGTLQSVEAEDKTVLLAVLARNKAHVLPYYLHCIDNLDYDKKKITVYINTNNNQDNTVELLRNWIVEKGSEYRGVIYESHEVEGLLACSPHHWTAERFKVLGAIRNRSMEQAVSTKSDFYFVVDCDNFIVPSTLRDLVVHNKPIIAPMLRAIPDPEDGYSNFFTVVDEQGYWGGVEGYYPILLWEKVGAFDVPVVHCTYLIQTHVIPELTYIDASSDHEFVIFSRRARERGIGQFICNEKFYGYVLHPDETITLPEEVEMIHKFMAEANQ